MFGNNKKNAAGSGSFMDTYGKTEAVNNVDSLVSDTQIPVTVAAPSGGIIFDTEDGLGSKVGSVPVENYGATMPANMIQQESGESTQPVVGWLVCVKGSAVGKEFRIHSDYNYVGSASGDIVISGDPKISRERHMRLSYVPKTRKYYVSPDVSTNMIYLNGDALLAPAELKNYDEISTGDTTLLFVGFCGEHFGWEDLEKA